jgi:hypothetical protein
MSRKWIRKNPSWILYLKCVIPTKIYNGKINSKNEQENYEIHRSSIKIKRKRRIT